MHAGARPSILPTARLGFSQVAGHSATSEKPSLAVGKMPPSSLGAGQPKNMQLPDPNDKENCNDKKYTCVEYTSFAAPPGECVGN